MRDSDLIFDLLEKNVAHELSQEEILILKSELKSEEIEQYSEVIGNFKTEDKSEIPHPSIKHNLMIHFNSKGTELESKMHKRKSLVFLKIAAVGIIIMGLGYTFHLLFLSKDRIQETKISMKEFNKNTQAAENIDEVKSQLLSEDSEYLMNMEFFSNPHLTD